MKAQSVLDGPYQLGRLYRTVNIPSISIRSGGPQTEDIKLVRGYNWLGLERNIWILNL